MSATDTTLSTADLAAEMALDPRIITPPSIIRSNWLRVCLGDVVTNTNVNTRNPIEDGYERYVGLEHLDGEDLRIKRWGNIADGTTFTRIFRTGQVLFGKRRAYQRKVAVATFDGICSSDILVFEAKPDRLLPDLLPFIAQSEGFFLHALGTSAGSLSPRTKWSELAKYTFSLPSEDKQREIAANLWMVEETRNNFIHCLKCLHELDVAVQTYFFLPQSNGAITLGDLVKKGDVEFLTGPFGTVLSASDYTQSGIAVINPVNMEKGKLLCDKGPFVSPLTAARLERYKLALHDIVLSRKGEMGKIAYVDSNAEGLIVGSDCFRIRVKNNAVDPFYLACFLSSPSTRRWMEAQSHGTILAGLNEKLLAKLPLSLPDTEYQNKVINELKRLNDGVHAVNKHIQRVQNVKRQLSEFYFTLE